MDYAKHYWALIDRARRRRSSLRVGIERHHILPRCMGGGDENDNLAHLKSGEHYIAHLLLAKIHPDNRKLAYAYACMKKLARGGHAGSENKRYARRMRGYQADSWRKWRFKYAHRPKGKKRYSAADVERMIGILAPKRISA